MMTNMMICQSGCKLASDDPLKLVPCRSESDFGKLGSGQLFEWSLHDHQL